MTHKGAAASSPFDLITAGLVAVELVFSLASAAIVLHLQFRAHRRRPHSLNSLWPVRLLLLLLASLLSLLELLRLPLLPSPRLCAAHSFLSPSLAEPAFLSTLLSLLRASAHPRPLSFSLLSALAASLPLLFLNTLFLSLPNSFLLRLGLPPHFLGHADADACALSLFSTLLLAALAAVYVPLFVSAVWSAVAVVINRRLRTRLYVLSAAVTASLSVQIGARALAALWVPASAASQALSLASFVALLVAVVAGEAILVVQPVVDSLAAVDANDKRLRLGGGGSGGV